MQKAKVFTTQLLWEFIGSVFIAAGIYNFAVQAKFPMIGIFSNRYNMIEIPENPVIGNFACTAKL